MATLSIRKLDNTVYEQLRIRAAKHGVSMEEEVRQILSQVVTTPEKMSAVFEKYFGKKNGIELDLSQRDKPHEPQDFDK